MADQLWKCKKARKLVAHYQAQKPKVMAGNPAPLKQPRFIAGMLLKMFGSMAHERYESMQHQKEYLWPEEVGRLLKAALKDEATAEYGKVTCKFCMRESSEEDDLMQWITTVKKAWWACPECTEKEHLETGADVEEPN